jgi:DNA-binding PadR family transcriptional regulator
VNNPYTLSKLLESLSKEGLINYSINEFGRKSYNISLTQKGRDVAEHLMKLDAISKGKKLPSTERYAVILYLYRNGSKNNYFVIKNSKIPDESTILNDLELMRKYNKNKVLFQFEENRIICTKDTAKLVLSYISDKLGLRFSDKEILNLESVTNI